MLLKPSASLKEVVMLSYDSSFKQAPKPFWFLLRRNCSVPRKLDWDDKRRRRFFLPVDEMDTDE